MDQPALGHRQTELRPQNAGHLPQRHAQLGMQLDDQRGDVRTQLRAGRPQRVGSLQPVPALDAPLTLRAIAHLDLEVPNDRFDLRELFLILRRHVAARNRAAAVRTRRRDRRRVRLVDLCRTRAATVTAVGRTRTPSRTPAAALRPVFRERSGLPAPGAARRRQLLFQVVVLALQTVDLRAANCRSDAADPCPRARGASALLAAARSRRAGVESGRRGRHSRTAVSYCRVEGRRVTGRARWLIRRFRAGPQSESRGHVSSPRSPNPACRFPAPGSPVESCGSHTGFPV